MVFVVAAGFTAVVPATRTEAAPPGPVSGKSANRALGNGLGRLVQQSADAKNRRAVSGPRLDQDALTIRDAEGRVLVDLTPQAGVDRAAYRRQAAALGLQVRAVDSRRGTLEGFVPLDAVPALAALEGTGTLAQAVRPQVRAGAVADQGVALQQVDKVQATGVKGAGITVGALSDSYDTATTDVTGRPLTIHAAQDVASGDLPGTGNAQNSQPVVDLQEPSDADGTVYDEGRGMLQIVHDVAPDAKLCFATAYTGLVGFADNVRRLADTSGRCGADVLVDDITYLDEPMFSDSVLNDAIDDVTADGVHYFSAAGNSGEQQAWSGRSHLVSLSQGLKGTNLDFSDVDPAYYSGGLQDMHVGTGVDVAQTLRVGAGGGQVDLQWDDPTDLDGARYGPAIFTGSGAVTTNDPAPELSFTATRAQVGKTVEFRTDAIPTGSTDLVLTVTAPDGSELGSVDTTTSPEVLGAKLTQAGTYTITVSGYDGDTGDFTVDVRPVLSASKVSTDYNALFFDTDGNFLFASADLNSLSGRPAELAALNGFDETTDIQMVISRSGTGKVGATRLRTVLFGDAYLHEYVDPLAPAIFGHPAAKGATAVAAYDPFRPYLPEYFTSPGGSLAVFFDSEGRRYDTLQRRRVPQIASADGGNTTFFGSDSRRDTDSRPNFFGTSAAAPHAAAIAALVLQKAGGPDSVSPAAMRTRLKQSTYAHDLDPDHSAGTVSGLTVSASGAQGSESSLVAGSMYDRRFFTISYTGSVPIRAIRFYGEGASPTALGTSGSRSAGIVFDPRAFSGQPTFENKGFPFRIGGTSGGLTSSTVKATYSAPGGTAKGQYHRMLLGFSKGIRRGQTLQFGVDRDLVVSGLGSSRDGNGADELGGETFLPAGTGSPAGMKFAAYRTDGKKITGVLVNKLGAGYTAVDGYGLVDAERAVTPSAR